MRFPTTLRGGSLRPLVPLRLLADNGRWGFIDALVDSGADVCIFPMSVAQQLNLDLSTESHGSVIAAVGGRSDYRTSPLMLELRRFPDVHRWKASVCFVDRPMSYAILGTRGFFEFFRFDYVAGEHSFEISSSTVLPS